MGGRFTQAIEIAHQQYFAEHERPWDRPPPEIEERLPRAAILFVELTLADWDERMAQAVSPLTRAMDRVRSGAASAELQEAVQEFAQLSAEELDDRWRSLEEDVGDPLFEVLLGVFLAVSDEPGRVDPWEALGGILLPGFVRRFAKDASVPVAEAKIAIAQAAYEVVVVAVERGDRAERQRYVFKTAVWREAMKILHPSYQPKTNDPERLAARLVARLAEWDARDPDADAKPDAWDAETHLFEKEDLEDVERLIREKGFTKRERELALALVLGGAPSIAEAGRKLGIKDSTARAHVLNIRKKLSQD